MKKMSPSNPPKKICKRKQDNWNGRYDTTFFGYTGFRRLTISIVENIAWQEDIPIRSVEYKSYYDPITDTTCVRFRKAKPTAGLQP